MNEFASNKLIGKNKNNNSTDKEYQTEHYCEKEECYSFSDISFLFMDYLKTTSRTYRKSININII